MASPNDNTTLRDGLDAIYQLRTKDVSALSDGSLQTVRHLSTLYPIDYGAGGSYQMTSKSAVIGAGIPSGSPIFAFRWTSTVLIALLKRVRLQAWTNDIGFAAGLCTFDVYRATAWLIADTGGLTNNLTLNNATMRTGMATSVLSEMRYASTSYLVAGTRTLDIQPFESLTLAAPVLPNTALSAGGLKLFEKLQGEHPLILGPNEGFVIRATVPATGTWSFAITPEWDEVPPVNF